jgi:serine/threonine-protein kinase
MSPQDWQDIRRIFDRAVQLDGCERDAFLAEACGGNVHLREQVQLLLRADEAVNQSDSNAHAATQDLPTAGHRLPLNPGDKVRAYQVGRILGTGISGVVYEGTRSDSSGGSTAAPSRFPRQVAIKALYPERFDKDGMLRFEREREALRRLQHPHIAQFYDSGQTESGVPFLLIERIDGQSLQEKFSTGQYSLDPQTLGERIGWMIQVASGVQAAHQELILHRDLKPANVMIDRSGRAVLTDFGLARFLEPLAPRVSRTSAGRIMGTPQYMAPEQVLSHPTTLATDVYGLGGILYFLLTGNDPFHRPTFYETCQAVRDEQPVAPSMHCSLIPKDLETICLKCLSKRPELRYQSVETLLQDLDAFQKGRPIQARPVSTVTRLGYWARRNRALAGISALAVIGGTLSVGAIAVLWRTATTENKRAQQNLELAQQNMELAQQTSQQLLAMVGRFTQSLKVAEQNPTTLKLQQDLLSSISHSYDQLPDQDQLDQGILRDIAVCRYKLGLVQKQLGLLDDFLISTRQAEAIFRRLTEAEPDNPMHWFDLFHCLNNLRLPEQALQAVEEANRLEKQPSKDYRDALAHARFKVASLWIHYGKGTEAERLCEQTRVLIDEINQEDIQDWRSWKLKGEFYHVWGRCALLRGDQQQALQRLQTADESCARTLDLKPDERQTIFSRIRNCESKLSIYTANSAWDQAQLTLDQMEPSVQKHEQLQSRALEEFRVTSRFWEAQYFVSQHTGDSARSDQAASHWRESVERWLEAYPEDPLAQREHLWTHSVLHRHESSEQRTALTSRLFSRLSPVGKESSHYFDVLNYEMLSLFLLGDVKESQHRARLYLNGTEQNTFHTQPQPEIPYLILGIEPPKMTPSGNSSQPSEIVTEENWKLATWDYWRNQFHLECLFPERTQNK